MTLPIGIQLFTVRDAMKDEFEGTLKQMADAGYDGVEWAGLHGKTPEEAKKLIDQLGLRSAGSHVGLNAIQGDLTEQVELARTLGYDLLTVPALPGEMRNPAGFREAARLLNQAGATLKDQGISLCYHNHAFEFETVDGERGMDILFAETDPAVVGFELDLGWVYVGGEDPKALAAKVGDRIPLLHIKDFARPEGEAMCEVGSGTIDWDPIVKAADEQWSTRWLIVEQDHSWVDGDAVKSARTSAEYMSRYR